MRRFGKGTFGLGWLLCICCVIVPLTQSRLDAGLVAAEPREHRPHPGDMERQDGPPGVTDLMYVDEACAHLRDELDRLSKRCTELEVEVREGEFDKETIRKRVALIARDRLAFRKGYVRTSKDLAAWLRHQREKVSSRLSDLRDHMGKMRRDYDALSLRLHRLLMGSRSGATGR